MKKCTHAQDEPFTMIFSPVPDDENMVERTPYLFCTKCVKKLLTYADSLCKPSRNKD